MFYLLVAAIVAVIIFVVGYSLGKASTPKTNTSDKFVQAELDKAYRYEVALQSIKTGSTNPILEAELALDYNPNREIN